MRCHKAPKHRPCICHAPRQAIKVASSVQHSPRPTPTQAPHRAPMHARTCSGGCTTSPMHAACTRPPSVAALHVRPHIKDAQCAHPVHIQGKRPMHTPSVRRLSNVLEVSKRIRTASEGPQWPRRVQKDLHRRKHPRRCIFDSKISQVSHVGLVEIPNHVTLRLVFLLILIFSCQYMDMGKKSHLCHNELKHPREKSGYSSYNCNAKASASNHLNL